MVTPTEERKLAAIMFTDMVGYSALAQRDDKVALELLEEHRRLLREIFPRFHGIEIKTIGDAFLVEFGSALEAAQCAIEIQRTLAKRNHDVTSDRRIELKIGIHIGDVVHREGDVYGDGVNIASRIEQLAGAGGICVSMDVERQIRNALEARFEKFGSADLKNIKLPMDLFRIVLPWEKGAEISAKPTSKKSPVLVPVAALIVIALLVGWWWMQRSSKNHQLAAAPAVPVAPATVPDQKSVAVLPFVNLSDDKGSEYFSDGVSEELLTVLQKIPGMHVAARTSAFSFKGKNATAQEIGQKLGVAHLVDGSVRKSGDAVRIAARLTRADTGEELWSENYTRDLKDVFAVQTELAQTIVEQLRGRFGGANAGSTAKEKIQAEVQAAEKGGTKNVDAHELYLQGRFYENRHSEKVRAKLWLLTNTRSRWTLDLPWRGPASPRRISGLPRLRPKVDKKISTLIWPPRATPRLEPCRSSLTCLTACSPKQPSRPISILTGTRRLRPSAKRWPWRRQIRTF